MTTNHHHLPERLPPRLGLRTRPPDARRAQGYDELVALLEELGKQLDRGGISRADLRKWEAQVLPHLREGEVDIVMAGSDEAEFDVEALPEHRWNNLKKVLFSRKGLDV